MKSSQPTNKYYLPKTAKFWPINSSSAFKKFYAYVCPGWFKANCLGNFCLLNVTGNGSFPEFGRLTYLTSNVSSAKK